MCICSFSALAVLSSQELLQIIPDMEDSRIENENLSSHLTPTLSFREPVPIPCNLSYRSIKDVITFFYNFLGRLINTFDIICKFIRSYFFATKDIKFREKML